MGSTGFKSKVKTCMVFTVKDKNVYVFTYNMQKHKFYSK